MDEILAQKEKYIYHPHVFFSLTFKNFKINLYRDRDHANWVKNAPQSTKFKNNNWKSNKKSYYTKKYFSYIILFLGVIKSWIRGLSFA